MKSSRDSANLTASYTILLEWGAVVHTGPPKHTKPSWFGNTQVKKIVQKRQTRGSKAREKKRMIKPPNPQEIEAFIVEIGRISLDDPYRDTINCVASLAKDSLELLATLLREWKLKGEG